MKKKELKLGGDTVAIAEIGVGKIILCGDGNVITMKQALRFSDWLADSVAASAKQAPAKSGKKR